MLANAWVLELIRYFRTAYLLFLEYKAARSALTNKDLATKAFAGGKRALYAKGLALHLTNPKAILFFGSLISLGIPPEAGFKQLALVIAAVGVQSLIVFHGFALLFSSQAMTNIYLKLRCWFEGASALGFGAASFKILTAMVQSS